MNVFKRALKYIAGAACGVAVVAVSPLAPDAALSLTNACGAAFGATAVALGVNLGPRILESLGLRKAK